MNKRIGGSCFLWYNRYNLENLRLNINHLVIQIYHSALKLFMFIVFVLLSYIFSRGINRQVLRRTIFIQNFLDLISMTAKNKLLWIIGFTVFHLQEYGFHAHIWIMIKNLVFCCMLCKQFIVFMIKSISCFQFLTKSLGN